MIEILGLDCDQPIDPVEAIRKGYKFIFRYLSPNTLKHPRKQLTLAEADSYRDAGLEIGSIWETAPNRSLEGHGAGKIDASLAIHQALVCKLPQDRPIFFCGQDEWYPAVDFPYISTYYVGINEVLPTSQIGNYSGFYVMKLLFDQDLIKFGWQTPSWSKNAAGIIQWDPRAQIHQFRPKAQDTIKGITVDVNTAVQGNYGQWGYFKPLIQRKGGTQMFIMVRSDGQATRVWANGFDVYDNVAQVRAWQRANAAAGNNLIPTIHAGQEGFTDDDYARIIEDLKTA